MGNIGINDILGVCQCEDEVNGRGHCFEVITPSRAYLFSADSDSEMTEWISIVKQVKREREREREGRKKKARTLNF